ncbi:gliding motility-associated C-terminal domain-containing protein [Flavobacterium azooxidireducens]|uniref:Gliding motility-associated C-terminal domain-containing protein n=1 Tax=Flavobacterium azooxidireducens TaxID=1871076 RepID=A0ABY4KDU0_9FLAO|nr:gliding motility-associated C-terminal domain-containing protein [Flavobacterium azooxidireducens]UPQ78476.1 gliding motility-associated C-terminal domain-containing protein [Flavobacterium azooxidireducens]
MQFTTTFQRKAGLKYVLLFITYIAFQHGIHAQSVPEFATTISSQSNVDFSNNSIDGNLTTRARVRASSGIALGIGAYSGHLEIQFPSTLPANTTSFVKIQTDDNLLPALLGGSLGGLLSDVVGGILIGNQEFTVQAKNGGSVVLEGNSQIISQFSTNRLRIVVNKDNDYFIAITPNQSYDRIRLTNRVGSLVGLNNTKRLDVFGVYYIGTPDVCGGASYTSFEGSGLNLDLLGLGGAGVANPHFVLDANQNNYSRLSLGILAVAASIEQTVYFDGLSEPTDRFYIRMRVDPSLLALGVANNIQIIASNGPTVVQTVNLNSLLNLDLLTLLQGNQVARIPFAPNATVNRITVRYNSLLNVQLTQSLDLYDVIRTPAPPVITDEFSLNAKICAGSTAPLIAETGVGTELNWYSQPTGGTILATTASGEVFVTPVLNSNTSFYVSSKRIGCPEESIRLKVDVVVVNLPLASDITIPDELVACNGVIMLSPSSSIGGAVFKYYKDQLKTQEITTGFSGDAGVTYVKNETTGELSISGLNEIDSPYNYYISITVDGLCENEINTLKQVTVNYYSSLILQVSSTIEGCGSVNLRDAILNFDNSADIQYKFFDADSNPITEEQASSITTSGIYFIQSTSLSEVCSSSIEQVAVTINPVPTLEVSGTHYVVAQGNTFSLQATSTGTVVWFDSDGNQVNSTTVGPFDTIGFYTYTAVATIGNCFVSRTIFLTVTNPNECALLTERVYANTQNWSSILTGGVANASQAVDGNPQTFSTMVTGLGLLGVGTTWQTLQWNETISAGTPVKLKLGSEYSGLILAGAYSVIGTKRNAQGIPIEIGVLQPISGSLLNLLSGQNVFEYSFIPSDNTGPKDYDGVRIIVGSLLSIAQNVKVYEAYYDKQVTQLVCSPNNIKDVFFGALDLGVGVATATVGVSDALNSIDDDEATYATMFSGAGILAAAELTVEFRTPTLQGDSLHIVLSNPSTVLSMNLLTGFTIQMYLGDSPIGLPLDNESTLLSLTLLNGGTEAVMIVSPQTQVYDKIKIRLGGVASVLDILRIHYVKRVADTSVIGADVNNTIEVCQNDIVRLSVNPIECATFIWYDAPIDGNIVSTGSAYTVPSTLPSGTYTYYIQPIRFGCPAYERGVVTVVVGENAPANSISQVLINGSSETTLCSDVGSITLEAELNNSLTITNPIFYWYVFDGTNTVLIPNESSATLVIPNLAAGNYTYSVGLSSDEYCQTLEADRMTVSLTILPSSTEADINVSDVLVCANTDAVLTPSSSQLNPQFFWFFSNDNSQPITDGLVVDGATFTFLPNGQLTISGLTDANSPYTYYVGMSTDATCLNQTGDFKPVIVTVNDSGTPTTNNTDQSFCLADNPTLASIQINETNIVWYDLAVGGILLPSSTPLVSGSIYYAAFDASTGCESSVRLAITVTVNDASTPTTTDSTQDFCISDNPFIGDIQVNEADVVWYSAPTGGEALDVMSSLVDGATYYASLTDAATGCESSIRLAITVTLNDTETPSTNDTMQDFCLTDNPTIGDIQVNEPTITWYDFPTEGTALALTDNLVNNTTYYASLTDAITGCESSVRLAVSVTITDLPTPTTNNVNQTFCLINNPTIADIQVNETNIVWYATPTNGTALDSSTSLVNGGIYYAALFDVISGCESTIRLAITITIDDPSAPTTNNTMQDFCLIDNPTVADIQVNESTIVWYDSPSGGTALSLTTVLVDGAIYYAAFLANSGCESFERVAITVNIIDSATPTTNDSTQDFCLIDNPTVADIQVNESNIIWYASPTGGTVLSSSEALVGGAIYYASFDGIVACESSIRLAVTVTVSDGPTPTTTNNAQDFCSVDNPTIASIQVNEIGVIWYNSLTGGTALNITTPLTAGTYYAALVDPISGCESSIRLAITVSFSSSEAAFIQGGGESACVFEEVTYTTNSGMSNYNWTVLNGTIVSGGQSTDNFVTVSWTAISTGNVSVTYSDDCSGTNSASMTISIITCSDITITKTVDNPTPTIGQNVNFTITVSNVGSGNFQDVIVSEVIPSGYSFVSATASLGTYSNVSGIWTIPLLNGNQSATLVITVEVLSSGDYLNTAFIDISNPIDLDPDNNFASAEVEPLCLIVYNEFSPNGDGANETFRIDCIENFPNNKLEVYNRYGRLVFSQNGYNNNWDGTANVSGVVTRDEKLPGVLTTTFLILVKME